MKTTSRSEPWPAWYAPHDAAAADAVTREMTHLIWDHRVGCPRCQRQQPCTTMQKHVGDAHEKIKVVGDKAFSVYAERLEHMYGSGKP